MQSGKKPLLKPILLEKSEPLGGEPIPGFGPLHIGTLVARFPPLCFLELGPCCVPEVCCFCQWYMDCRCRFPSKDRDPLTASGYAPPFLRKGY